MFLVGIRSITRRLRSEDNGAALAAVLGLMLVGMLVTTLIVSSVSSGLGYTTATRASVQSQAAAEAGADVAVAALKSGSTCAPTYSSTVSPAYAATLSYTTSTSLTAAGLVWVTECPTPAARFVKIVSKGTPVARGVAGNKSGDTRSVEAIYNYVPATASISASGGAVYTYSAVAGSGLNDLTLSQGQSIAASVQIRTGSVTCQNGTSIDGDVILGNGSFSGSGSCKVTGNLAASGSVTLNSGANVLKNVTASGIGVGTTDPVVSVYGTGPAAGNGNAVTGSVLAGGEVYIDGRIGVDVTSAKYPTGTIPGPSIITPATKIAGKLAAAGSFETWATRCASPNTWDAAGNACALTSAGGKVVAGSVNYGVASLTAPAAPAVPNWVDYKYAASDWTSSGFQVVTWPNDADHCRIDNRTKSLPFVTALNSYTTPTVIDASACAQLDLSNDSALSLSLKTDVAFIAKGFNLGALTANSATSAARKMWFIVSDGTADASPTCAAGGNVDINNAVVIGGTVAAIVYTPCQIANSSAVWRGQMYGNAVNFGQDIILNYVPVGLPNVDLGAGTTTPPGSTTSGGLGTRVSLRDLRTGA